MDGLAMALRPGCRCATWRWCSSTRRACSPGRDTRMTGTVLEEGLRGAGGYLLNGERRALHGRLRRRAASGRRATSSAAASTPRCAQGATTPQRRRLHPDGASGAARRSRSMFKGMVDALRRLRLRPRRRPGRGGADRALFHGRRDLRAGHARPRCPRLYVAGEDAGGVHGANRLGGNGVANSTVFGGDRRRRHGGGRAASRLRSIPTRSVIAAEIDARADRRSRKPARRSQRVARQAAAT